MTEGTTARQEALHRRGVRLEIFTISWNVVEAVVAIGAGIIAGSVALVGFVVDSGIEVLSAVLVGLRPVYEAMASMLEPR